MGPLMRGVFETAAPPPGGAGEYRPYVDGLRAIAIVSVVCGHAGIPGFGGGFVGVDVFFVISGYLIIGQIADALRRGTFSFADFWARRVLRIVPPMLAMLLACLLIAPFVLVTPAEFREFQEQFLFTALMAVNVYLLDTQGYFDTEAILKPLLHMWSLAVEEQFYLLAPLALFAGWKLRVRAASVSRYTLCAIAALIFVLSFVSSILLSSPEKNFAFYVVLCRAWEFMAGGALIFLRPQIARLSRGALEALALSGLSLIAASVTLLHEASVFPSYLAAFPVAGTAMVIAAGSTGTRILASRLLSLWPFTAIGLVSYAWYLWHWPLLSFVRIHNFGEADLRRDLMAVLVALAAAAVSYFVIERPIRALRQAAFVSRASRRVVAAGVSGLIAVALAAMAYNQAFVAAAEQRIAEAMRPEKDTKVMRSDPCWMRDPDVLPPACAAAIGAKRVIVLIGDSHARMLYPALKDATERSGLALVSLWRTGCSPFVREQSTLLDPKDRKCDNYAALGLATLKRELPAPPDSVIVGGYWSKILRGVSYSEYRLNQAAELSPPRERTDQFTASVTALLDRMSDAGVRRAMIVGPAAEFVRLPVECAARADIRGMPSQVCNVEQQALESWVDPSVRVLRDAVKARPGAIFVDAMEIFCPGDSCAPVGNGVMYFTDTHHVSAEGARRMVEETGLLAIYRSQVGHADLKRTR